MANTDSDPRAASAPPIPRRKLSWALSKSVGGVTEIAVLVPVRKGLVPGERRTYEERLRAAIDNLADRHRKGLPIELNRISAIHFGRMIIIRPEQYLLHSNLSGIAYYPKNDGATSGVPLPIDEYTVDPPLGSGQPAPELRSFLLTLVEFDGDLKVYMRDIAKFLAGDFDRVFVNCDDYPGTEKFEAFWLWLRRYQINTNLFYAPYSDLSVVRIKQLEDFKRRFDAFVARVRSPQGTRVGAMDELFDEFLRETQQHASDFPSAGGLFGADNGQD